MLIELLSQSNYQSFNINLAHLFGLESAIYLSVLVDINEKAYRKNKIDEDGFFNIDRKYVTSRTTLAKNTQEKLEVELKNLGVIELKDNLIKLNIDILTSLLLEENEHIKTDLSNFRKATSKKSKGEYILESVKKHIDKNLPIELQEAYANWLESVYSKINFINKQTLFNAQKEVDAASNHNLDTAIEIINIATASGWKDMRWAVKLYKEQHTNVGVVEHKDVNVDWSTSY